MAVPGYVSRMLRLSELRRCAAALEKILDGARLQRSAQPSPQALALSFYRGGAAAAGTQHILLCCAPESARVSRLAAAPPAPPAPPAFDQILRARAGGAVFAGSRVIGDDRQLGIRLRSPAGEHELLLSILGPRSNVYLLGGDGTVLAALRPFEETRRELARGAAWKSPDSPPPPPGEDRWAEVSDELYLDAVEATYAALERRRAAEALSRRIDQALRRQGDFLERKAAKLEGELAGARDAPQIRRLGELLKTVLHAVRPGDAAATAADFESGEPVQIALDPTLSAAANLERYFKRYHKAVKAEEVVERQLEETRRQQRELAEVAAAFTALGADADAVSLRGFAARPRLRKLLERYFGAPPAPKPPPAKKGKREIPARLAPRRYRTADDLEVWVGRSDEGNDYLTTRLARGNDLFFHLDGAPGSHVVLRTGGRQDPPPESLLEACELAVHFSRRRDEPRAEVRIAAIKDVRKPKGAKPGLVHVYRSKTVHLRRDPARLERILAARIEE